jgi:predicted lactoylglutathione lyase
MLKQVFINLPVENLAASTAFYQALGFTQNPVFSNDRGSCMNWTDEITVMLLVRDFYQTFLTNKVVADTKQTSGVLLCLSMESKEAVQQFAETAKQQGGDYFQVESGVSSDMMFGYEVQDLDGHTWEPLWMNPNFAPNENA